MSANPLTPLGLAEEILVSSRALVDEMKASLDTLTVSQAMSVYSTIRQAEGWLESARRLLEPEGGL